ncbi:uncharacterized protein MYCFIDRAFT_177299 [Pseudocercospora fijiensis CIRAD86]|uniref:Carrier domain-containing protein n=1 Tax=Pseudocercospora fijiensis (strain CIRAD86) TaxID=383855 RepID=M3AT90_PSEFD|nr:uncharacterized protein MYCFIDRAFT_177299 [Pseudocercospora fijiensis CIRAD86]EME80348.1 hypothetical protein MYCFIDRAFT_177299 [Pseudocercospora fijiensis CIRAD86]
MQTNKYLINNYAGSTGIPKGVLIEHRGIVRLVKNNTSVNRLPPHPRVAHMSNLAFDAATWEIYGPLLNGGSVVCVDHMAVLDAERIREVFHQQPIVEATFITPALLRSWLAHTPSIFAGLQFLLVGGEPVDTKDLVMAKKLAQSHAVVGNVYGPTENTTFSTIHFISDDEEFPNGVPIGRGISNTGAFVIDGRQRLLTAGAIGELFLTGDGLARGYMDSALNQDHFVELSFLGAQPVRGYRTGDEVRLRPKDGRVEFIRRLDQQLKIRGQRVEIAEIEHIMIQQQEVRNAAVVISTASNDGRPEIICFITTTMHEENTDELGKRRLVQELRDRLRSQLPSYMIPSKIAVLERMPVNSNGKTDRKALLEQAQHLSVVSEGSTSIHTAAPRNDTERKLCEIYARVLSEERDATTIGIDQNFFDLGGHSLLATSLAAHIRRDMDIAISVKEIFQYPTVADLAEWIHSTRSKTPLLTNGSSSGNHHAAALQLLDVDDPERFISEEVLPRLKDYQREAIVDVYPATQLQKTYLYDPRTGLPRPWVNFYWDLNAAESDINRVVHTCRALTTHFDIFRTTFVCVGGVYRQVVLKRLDVPIEVHDTETVNGSCVTISPQHARLELSQEGQAYLRFAICRVPGSSHTRVHLRISHALYDGLSFTHILHAFHALYNDSMNHVIPQSGRYIRYMLESRTKGLGYWRSLLDGSTLTAWSSKPPRDEQMPATRQLGCYIATKTIPVPTIQRKDGITAATIFTAACARTIFTQLNSTTARDIVFGRVVSGRQHLPLKDQDIVGPCTNTVPVRVILDQDGDGEPSSLLLRKIQQQYLNGIPFETIGFEEIRDHCTSWPALCGSFWCATAYNDFSLGEAVVDAVQGGARELSVYEVEMGGVVQEGELIVSVSGQQEFFDRKSVDGMLELVCRMRTGVVICVELDDPTFFLRGPTDLSRQFIPIFSMESTNQGLERRQCPLHESQRRNKWYFSHDRRAVRHQDQRAAPGPGEIKLPFLEDFHPLPAQNGDHYLAISSPCETVLFRDNDGLIQCLVNSHETLTRNKIFQEKNLTKGQSKRYSPHPQRARTLSSIATRELSLSFLYKPRSATHVLLDFFDTSGLSNKRECKEASEYHAQVTTLPFEGSLKLLDKEWYEEVKAEELDAIKRKDHGWRIKRNCDPFGPLV